MSINYSQLIIRTLTEDSAIIYAQELGLIKTTQDCICGETMKIRQRNSGKNKGLYFRCPSGMCRKEISIRKNTFFEHSHMSVQVILRLTYKFVRQETNIENLKHELEINSDTTIVDWLSFLREICMTYFIMNPIVLGGEGHIVEIDECYLVKRKYHLGHLVRECWILGIHDYTTNLSCFIHVLDRTKRTLNEKIQQHVLIGSTIFTDQHGGYNDLNNLGYNHFTVNHTTNFVNPINGATTNHIESKWQKLKQVHKQRYGTHRTTLNSHLSCFMWQERFKKNFEVFVSHIVDIYNPNN